MRETLASARPKHRLLRLTDALHGLALLGATLGAIPSIVGARQWMLDNLTSATLHLFVVLLVLAAFALVRRQPRRAVLAACTAALLSYRIYPYLDIAADEPAPPLVSWLVANVYTANLNHEALVALVRERRPDVIGLTETDSRWLRALDGPLHAYPYRVLHPREDNFGIALYSRLPLLRHELRDLGAAPTITASIALDDRELDLVLVHVLPPISTEYTRHRNEQLARIGALRPRAGHGLVIAGDLNATPYSPTFRASFDRALFKRVGGLMGTFPAALHPALRVPIDHVLIAGSVQARRTIERAIESDHLPLMLELWPMPEAR